MRERRREYDIIKVVKTSLVSGRLLLHLQQVKSTSGYSGVALNLGKCTQTQDNHTLMPSLHTSRFLHVLSASFLMMTTLTEIRSRILTETVIVE